MPDKFSRDSSGIVMLLDDVDETLLRDLGEVVRSSLLAGDVTDPIMHRLFPVPVLGDDVVAGDVQAMIHSDLLETRLEGIDALLALLDRGTKRSMGGCEVHLDDEDAALVLGVLNDQRIALGARIGIEHIDRAELEPEADLRQSLAVVDHLGWLQEQLLGVLDPESLAYLEDITDDDVADGNA